MGINIDTLTVLKYLLEKHNVRLGKTLMIGRQNISLDANYDMFSGKQQNIICNPVYNGYAEGLFRVLGSEIIDSMDFSNYENATIIHDLNKPILKQYKGAFDFIFDGGTLEHVFNFPVAIKSVMDMIPVGGICCHCLPYNNWPEHGFYQFTPEIFRCLYNENNGFELLDIVLYDVGNLELDGTNSEVEIENLIYRTYDKFPLFDADTRLVGDSPCLMMVMAVKKEQRDSDVVLIQNMYSNKTHSEVCYTLPILNAFIRKMNKLGYRKVALYGMGLRGQLFSEIFKDSSIEVAYAIDKRFEEIKSDIKIVHPKTELEKVDAIIITPIHELSEIKEMLNKKTDAILIDPSEFIGDLHLFGGADKFLD